MIAGPAWLPRPDLDAMASHIGTGLEHIPTEVLSATSGVLTSVEPATLVLGSVVSVLANEELKEYSRKFDIELQKYVNEHEQSDAINVRMAAGVSSLLPDGRELNQAALQAARGDPDALREQLQAYNEDEQRQANLDNAVECILTGEFDDLEETLTEAFNTRDTDAAQALLFDFMEVIRSRQTQQILEELLELDGRFEALSNDIDAMQEELEYSIKQSLIEMELRDEGFCRLSPLTFQHDIDDPGRPWRAGFEFNHVRRGFAVDRSRRDGTNVTEDLFKALQSVEKGTNRLVRGPAGSGKSTICKAVACRWYDDPDTGPVFYRESGRGGRGLESVGKLESAIRNSSGHVLVVVEDAVRPATDAIYDVIDEFEGTNVAVSFLLDARRGELEEFNDPTRMETGAEDALRVLLGSIERYDVPALDPDDPTECRLIVERFEQKTGREVAHSPEYIHREIVRSEGHFGELLYLTYFLPVDGDEAVGLKSDVRSKYETVLDPTGKKSQQRNLLEFDHDLFRDVGLMINLLNASRIGIHPELVHALGHVHGNDQQTHREIQHIREALEGWMLYPQQDPESNIEQTTHELWSALYLRRVALRYNEFGNEGFDRGSKERFEDCINALFRLHDNDEQRQALRKGFNDSELLTALADEPEPMAEELVREIFELGKRRPVLAPLYEELDLVLPDTCSQKTKRDVRGIQGHMHLKNGKYGAARTLYEGAQNLSKELNDCIGVATSLNNLGVAARKQTDYEAARDYHEDSLEIYKSVESSAGIATNLNNLGLVAQRKSDFDVAHDFHKESLNIQRELGNRAGIAACLNNLGLVAHKKGEYESAREHHRSSLEIKEELGDRSGIANSLGNLGLVARRQDDYESAHTFHKESLNIQKELGDRAGIATNLNNLGLVASEQRNFEAARDFYRESLEIAENLGDNASIASNLGNLGIVASEQHEYETARDLHKESLEIEKDLGNDAGIAESLGNLGLVAWRRGDNETAQEYYDRSARKFININATTQALATLKKLVSVCEELEDTEEAQRWCNVAIWLINESELSEVTDEKQWFLERQE